MKILPLYLPHKGCTRQCVYCNQPLVVGPGESRDHWRERLESLDRRAGGVWEIAFYGGTFSALPPEEMRECLQLVAPYARKPGVAGVRISTRPDCVSQATLDFLQASGVRTIELGVESLDDGVLRRSGRGHSSQDVRDACRRIRERGIRLGIHLMCGLPGQSRESFARTVRDSLPLQPDLVRIAPTLVLKNTPLEKMMLRGLYTPQTLEEAVEQCMDAYTVFHRHGIAIARLGLAISDATGDGVEKIAAGPWHPALRHEVESRLASRTIRTLLADDGELIRIVIHPKDLSVVYGERKKNPAAWRAEFNRELEILQDPNQPRHTLRTASGKIYSLFDASLERKG
ncbi:MAG: radical SAM protein [Candidatus Omnitrophica bacterium]|nr:radical SAM protein [Candidatus Omnitrophota bacterium]